MHYLYKVKSKVDHHTGVAGPVRYVDGESMWTNKKKADAAIGFGSAVRVNGGHCDPYLAQMEIDAPPGLVPTTEDVSMAMAGRWECPKYVRILRKDAPEVVAPAPSAPQEVAPEVTPEAPAKKAAKKVTKFQTLGE